VSAKAEADVFCGGRCWLAGKPLRRNQEVVLINSDTGPAAITADRSDVSLLGLLLRASTQAGPRGHCCEAVSRESGCRKIFGEFVLWEKGPEKGGAAKGDSHL
jgi:hypothetical protein